MNPFWPRNRLAAFSVSLTLTWRGDSYCPMYIPSATGESVNPVLNAIAFKVLPNTVGATPFDAGIMCGPVCVGG
jgi:hypothetical protein